MIRSLALLSCALWLLAAAALPAWAHRVNIFAYVEGSDILVESSFSRSQKVKQGKIEVRDATTQAVVAQGKTDDAGVFRFAVTPEMRKAGHDLLVRIVAGEGHQNDWTIAASEFAAPPASASAVPGAPVAPAASAAAALSTSGPTASPAAATSAAASAPGGMSPVTSTAGVASSAPAAPTASAAQALTPADVERIVNSALDAKLSPLKHMLAAQVEAGPSLKDIIGGMGWIFGLVGVAAYFRRRP